jgi:thiosulfate/3-mercaptopyruvate sulfurtransferase
VTPPFACRPVLFLASLAFLGASDCQRNASQEQKVSPTAPAGDMLSLQPEELARMLGQPGDKPLLFHVGFKKLYQQAHIPGSEFLGPTSDAEVLDRLRRRVANLPRTANIVLYCGCCPWEHCPNIKPAYRALRELGFSSAKVLFIPHDLGADWVDKGFPVATGE